jgi:hypothetical protein
LLKHPLMPLITRASWLRRDRLRRSWYAPCHTAGAVRPPGVGFVGAGSGGRGSRLGAAPIFRLHATALDGCQPHSTAPPPCRSTAYSLVRVVPTRPFTQESSTALNCVELRRIAAAQRLDRCRPASRRRLVAATAGSKREAAIELISLCLRIEGVQNGSVC